MPHDLMLIALRAATIFAWALAAFDLIPWGWDIADNTSGFLLAVGIVGACQWIIQAQAAAHLERIRRLPFDELVYAGQVIERYSVESGLPRDERSPFERDDA